MTLTSDLTSPQLSTHETLSIEILSTTAQLYMKPHIKSLQYVHDLESYSRSSEVARFDSPYHLLWVVCSKNTVLHHFPDITTSTVYMTTSNIEKSLRFDMTVANTRQVCIPIHM